LRSALVFLTFLAFFNFRLLSSESEGSPSLFESLRRRFFFFSFFFLSFSFFSTLGRSWVRSLVVRAGLGDLDLDLRDDIAGDLDLGLKGSLDLDRLNKGSLDLDLLGGKGSLDLDRGSL